MIFNPKELYTFSAFPSREPASYTWQPQPRLRSDDILPPNEIYPSALDQTFVFQPAAPVFDQYKQQLAEFYQTHATPSIRIDKQTGLPTLIYGILQAVDPATESATAAERFLQENQLIVSGVIDEDTQGVVLQPRLRSFWQDETSHFLYTQTNSERVPVFGSTVALTYQANTLTLITTSLQPISATTLDQLVWVEDNVAAWWGNWYALNAYPPGLQWQQFLPPPELDAAVRHARFPIDRCIFPYNPFYNAEDNQALGRTGSTERTDDQHMEDTSWYLPGQQFFDAIGDRPLIRSDGGGIYRPAWRVVTADTAGNHWLTMIDAETQQVLWLYSLDLHAPPVTILSDDAAHLLAVGSHLEQAIQTAQQQFGQWLGLSSLATTQPFDPINHVQVELNFEPFTRYKWQDQTIYIGGPVTGAAVEWPIAEPGLDPEVAFHEFIHAMTHFLRPQIMELTYNSAFDQTKGLNEGLGFFLACAHANDRNYAETAHTAWINPAGGRPWLDLETAPLQRQASFQLLNSPLGATHRRGLWWAKVFWAFGLDAAIGLDLARQLVLQALQVAVPVSQTSTFADVVLGIAQNRSDIDEVVVLTILQTRDAYL